MSRFDQEMEEFATKLISAGDLIRYALKIQSFEDCNTCSIQKKCGYAPEVGDPVRINCPLWKSTSDRTMSDYQVTNYGCCGECRHHKSDRQDNGFAYIGFYCDNKQSDYYTDYTDYTDTCDCFE